MTIKKEVAKQPAGVPLQDQREEKGSRRLREARVEFRARVDLRKGVNVLSTSSSDDPAPNPFVQQQNVPSQKPQSGGSKPVSHSNQEEDQAKNP